MRLIEQGVNPKREIELLTDTSASPNAPYLKKKKDQALSCLDALPDCRLGSCLNWAEGSRGDRRGTLQRHQAQHACDPACKLGESSPCIASVCAASLRNFVDGELDEAEAQLGKREFRTHRQKQTQARPVARRSILIGGAPSPSRRTPKEIPTWCSSDALFPSIFGVSSDFCMSLLCTASLEMATSPGRLVRTRPNCPVVPPRRRSR